MSDRRIYMDNGATSFPKAPGLGKVVADYIEHDCVNINRTESPYAMKSFDFLFSLRENLCRLYNYNHPECVVFTKNITEALNWLIKGMLSSTDHVVVTSLEHNAVMRPLVQRGIPFSRIPCDGNGYCRIDEVESLIKPGTKAMIVNAVSNVFGTVQDLKALADIAYKHNLMLFIDSAQASPYVAVDMEELHAAAVAFAGHKGLLGPQGTGGFIIRKELAGQLQPLVAGGTGSRSDSELLPPELPDRFTSGTENLPGLRGLSFSLDHVLENLPALKVALERNTALLYNGLASIPGIRIVGPDLSMPRTAVISIVPRTADAADLAAYLSEQGIETRVGMHCAPSAHKALGTFPGGTIRLSPGPFTTEEDIAAVLDGIRAFMTKQA